MQLDILCPKNMEQGGNFVHHSNLEELPTLQALGWSLLYQEEQQVQNAIQELCWSTQLQIISKGSTCSVSGTLFCLSCDAVLHACQHGSWLLVIPSEKLSNMLWPPRTMAGVSLLPLGNLSGSFWMFEDKWLALRENGLLGKLNVWVHYGSSLSLCVNIFWAEAWLLVWSLNLVFIWILISWMLDGHGDGREVERLGPIGELWRAEMRLLQAVKLGTNCVYGPFGLRTVNFASLRHAYHQFPSSTTKSKVSLVLLGEPRSKFSVEHSDFLFLGDQSFGELTCWVAAQGPTTLSIWWRTGAGLISVSVEYLQWCSVCDPAKIFFTSKFSSVLFSNPTLKTETRTASRWGTTNGKPPGPIIMMGQSETLSSS